jgi:hypothetical protein
VRTYRILSNLVLSVPTPARTIIAKDALGHDPLPMRCRCVRPQLPRVENAAVELAQARALERDPAASPARRARRRSASRGGWRAQTDQFPLRQQTGRRLLLAAKIALARLRPAALARPPTGPVELSFAHRPFAPPVLAAYATTRVDAGTPLLDPLSIFPEDAKHKRKGQWPKADGQDDVAQ